jgi:hypothetical protein
MKSRLAMNFWSFCLSLKAEIKGMHYHKAFCLICINLAIILPLGIVMEHSTRDFV